MRKIKERNMEIKSLSDERLIMINPLREGFYDKVLCEYRATTYDAIDFLEAVDEAKHSKVTPFWRPILDPSYNGEKIVFKKNLIPAVGYTFDWWKTEVKKMIPVGGKKWALGNNLQYIAFLVWLINSLGESGWTIEDAVNSVLDSKVLGRYGHRVYNMKTEDWETKSLNHTGKREICGIYDLTNTRKILCFSDEGRCHSHWIAGPNDYSLYGGLAKFDAFGPGNRDLIHSLGVAWLVLN